MSDINCEIDRAFAMLELYGVPRERAKTVANGIDVLVTRMRRENDAIRANAGQGERALREALEQAAQSLEALGRLAGKDEALLENDQVRGYAINRAAARAALGQSAGEES